MDGVDGYIARKYNQASELGSVLDIMGDRIVEASYWIAFAVFGTFFLKEVLFIVEMRKEGKMYGIIA